jgi:hypothetical protein
MIKGVAVLAFCAVSLPSLIIGGSQAQTSGSPTVTAIMVVWGPDGHYQQLVPMRSMLECEIAAPERQANDRRRVEAFCRPAEPSEQKAYKEIALIIRMTPSSTPIRVPMPTIEICEKAMAQARAELNPAQAQCPPPTISITNYYKGDFDFKR